MTSFQIGDLVKVHFKSANLGRGKTQVFTGVVIRMRGEGNSGTFTVLKDASAGVKVERIFPLASPLLEKVEVVKKPKKVRRSKLYFLRDRVKSQI